MIPQKALKGAILQIALNVNNLLIIIIYEVKNNRTDCHQFKLAGEINKNHFINQKQNYEANIYNFFIYF
ncbi:MAG: hypothetical protein EA362_05000 [Saprospirales bacterium]|nr:MAG: hypothetical protein EA362_05000 [Saprospirales bacterium]